MRRLGFITGRLPRFVFGLLAAIVLPAAVGRGDEADEKEPIFEATVIVNQDTYKLQGPRDGKAIDPRNPADPPKVDLTLQLKNVSDETMTYFEGADSGSIDLKLEGPGAVSIEPRIPVTREFRMGKPIAIEPGKSIEIPITVLHGGMRNVGHYWYWTKPGEYMLTATVRAAYRPGRLFADVIVDNPEIAAVAAKPVKLTVKE